MDDLIRRSDAIRAIEEEYKGDDIWRLFKKPLMDIPAVKPKHGEWIIDKVYYSGNGKLSGFTAKCSECGFTYKTNYSDYCPGCGTKMKIDKWWER